MKIDEPSDRRFCRSCLQPIFSEEQRITAERGALRARLMMADNGSEVAVCDNCWGPRAA